MAAQRRTRKPKVVRIEDPRGIRALAHPARMDAIDELYAGMSMTATELARKAGITPSAMSYHLRELEKWGVARRAAGSGDARERRWEAAGDDLDIGARNKRTTSSRNAQATLV